MAMPASASARCHEKTCAYTVSTRVPSRSKMSAGVNLLLYVSDRPADTAADGRFAAGQHRLDEILDERLVNVRGRRMRFAILPAAGCHPNVPLVQRVHLNRSACAEDAQRIARLLHGVRDRHRRACAALELQQRDRGVFDLPCEDDVRDATGDAPDGTKEDQQHFEPMAATIHHGAAATFILRG